MRLSSPVKLCPTSLQPCAGKCTGYGTKAGCPPLIVLAVLATSPVMMNAGAGR